MNQHLLQSIADTVTQAQHILIVSHDRPTADSIGSMLALYLGLQSLKKNVTVALPDQITVEHSSFVGVNKIVNEVSKKNFIISLDYQEGSIEKVSYNIEGKTFNLVIEPREGFDSFSQDKVHFRHAGAAFDAVFVIDTIHTGGLKGLYQNNTELFSGKPVINIDRHPNNSNFGTINVVDVSASSTAEVVYDVMKYLNIAYNQDIATNILNALYSATNNFTSGNISAKAFEIAAQAVRSGGKRFHRIAQADKQQLSEEVPEEEHAVTHGIEEAVPMQQMHTQKQSHDTQSTQKQNEPAHEDDHTDAPDDWLKPKIFKSSHLS